METTTRVRDALTNALTSLAHQVATGKKTIQPVVTICPHVIAPHRRSISDEGRSCQTRAGYKKEFCNHPELLPQPAMMVTMFISQATELERTSPAAHSIYTAA